MREHEVNAATKPHRQSPHEHITHIGNNTLGWCITREAAIQKIDAKTDAFYTVDKTTGKKVYIAVVRGDGTKAPYLRTHADGKWNDNLLALPDCTGSAKLAA